MANKVKTICDQGNAVFNGCLAIPSGFSAEMMAQGGFDSVTASPPANIRREVVHWFSRATATCAEAPACDL